jgi:hypothetical protein
MRFVCSNYLAYDLQYVLNVRVVHSLTVLYPDMIIMNPFGLYGYSVFRPNSNIIYQELLNLLR